MTTLVPSPTLPVRALGGLLKAPVTLAARARGEAHSIWQDARAVSRGGRREDDHPRPLTANEISIAWYLGLALAVAMRLINWRTALLVAIAHAVERSAHNRAVAELVEGIEAGL
jgi:hypothetical protein